MKRVLTVRNIYDMEIKTLDWSEEWQAAFGNPETTGVWFVFGNSSNGKSSFVMQLAKELSKSYRVLYNSLEEGESKTLQNTIAKNLPINQKNIFFVSEPMEELTERLQLRKSPHVVIIDSYQYTGMSFRRFEAFKNKFSNKLIIIISQAEGKKPMTRAANSVLYDAGLKIWVEGFVAHSLGRSNPGCKYVIWAERATQYWGTKNQDKL